MRTKNPTGTTLRLAILTLPVLLLVDGFFVERTLGHFYYLQLAQFVPDASSEAITPNLIFLPFVYLFFIFGYAKYAYPEALRTTNLATRFRVGMVFGLFIGGALNSTNVTLLGGAWPLPLLIVDMILHIMMGGLLTLSIPTLAERLKII